MMMPIRDSTREIPVFEQEGSLCQPVFLRMKIFTLALALTSLCALAQADSFSAVVVYGDSLSDNGNLFAFSGGTVPSPTYYFDGRRSNGPVAVEQLAAALGVPLVDLAWLGATTGIGNIGDGGTPTSVGGLGLPGMQAELAGTPAGVSPHRSRAQGSLWCGEERTIFCPRRRWILRWRTSPTGRRAISTESWQPCKSLGAQHILVPGIPDLGATPYFAGLGPLAPLQPRNTATSSTPTSSPVCPPGRSITTRQNCSKPSSPTRARMASAMSLNRASMK